MSARSLRHLAGLDVRKYAPVDVVGLGEGLRQDASSDEGRSHCALVGVEHGLLTVTLHFGEETDCPRMGVPVELEGRPVVCESQVAFLVGAASDTVLTAQDVAEVADVVLGRAGARRFRRVGKLEVVLKRSEEMSSHGVPVLEHPTAELAESVLHFLEFLDCDIRYEVLDDACTVQVFRLDWGLTYSFLSLF